MTKTKPPAKAQVDQFRALAKELECDPSEAAFEATVKKVAKAKPDKRECPT